MSSKPGFIPTHVFELECTSKQEAEDIAKLVSKYRQTMNICYQAELGQNCKMTDGCIVKECLLDGLRVTRKAVGILRQWDGKQG